MSAGQNAEEMEPDAYHKAEDLNNDDDASMYGHRDRFKVELKIDVLQVKWTSKCRQSLELRPRS